MSEDITVIGMIKEVDNKRNFKPARFRIEADGIQNWYSAFDKLGQQLIAIPLDSPLSIVYETGTYTDKNGNEQTSRTLKRFTTAPEGSVPTPPSAPAPPVASTTSTSGCAHGTPWSSPCGQCILREAVIKPVTPIVAAMIREGIIKTPHEVMHSVAWLTDQFSSVVQQTYDVPHEEEMPEPPPPPPPPEVDEPEISEDTGWGAA